MHKVFVRGLVPLPRLQTYPELREAQVSFSVVVCGDGICQKRAARDASRRLPECRACAIEETANTEFRTIKCGEQGFTALRRGGGLQKKRASSGRRKSRRINIVGNRSGLEGALAESTTTSRNALWRSDSQEPEMGKCLVPLEREDQQERAPDAQQTTEHTIFARLEPQGDTCLEIRPSLCSDGGHFPAQCRWKAASGGSTNGSATRPTTLDANGRSQADP